MRCFLCLDTESTGLSRARNRLGEVAAIEFDPVTLLRRSLNGTSASIPSVRSPEAHRPCTF